jgi:hypothetical protein
LAKSRAPAIGDASEALFEKPAGDLDYHEQIHPGGLTEDRMFARQARACALQQAERDGVTESFNGKFHRANPEISC